MMGLYLTEAGKRPVWRVSAGVLSDRAGAGCGTQDHQHCGSRSRQPHRHTCCSPRVEVRPKESIEKSKEDLILSSLLCLWCRKCRAGWAGEGDSWTHHCNDLITHNTDYLCRLPSGCLTADQAGENQATLGSLTIIVNLVLSQACSRVLPINRPVTGSQAGSDTGER